MEEADPNMEAADVLSEFLEPPPKGTKKLNPVGISYFGDAFVRFMKVGEVADLIPAFKDRYYAMKTENWQTGLFAILQPFVKECRELDPPREFTPYPSQIRAWRKKWDRHILEQKGFSDKEITIKRQVHQAIKTRDERDRASIGSGSYGELEAGVQTLGGELMNDALEMLNNDQQDEDIYTSDELMKRRNYVVNVFSHITKLVHGKAALALKGSEEKRNNANFLMGLLAKATSGNLSDAEMDALETVYVKPAPIEVAAIVEPEPNANI